MSVIAQSSDVSLELLVGDDCSTDGTSAIVTEIAQAYPDLVRVLRPGARLGSGSRNLLHLMAKARGQYIAHLDGDDFWLPGKLREQVEFLCRHPGVNAVYSNALVVDDARRMRGAFNAHVPQEFDLGFLLRRGNFLCHGSLLYRAHCRELLVRLDPPVLDYRFHIELARQGALGYVNSCLVGYRVASETSVSSGNSPLVQSMYLDVLAAVGHDQRWRGDLCRCYGQFLAMMVWGLWAGRSRHQLVAMIGRAWRDAPGPMWRLGVWLLIELVSHFGFKMANFLGARLLRRPLKIYFPR
jgi:glycosyltransferase involved in cell wall biosynthesis